MVDKYRDPSTLEQWPGAWNGIHMAEAAAYGLILTGTPAKALKWLLRTEELAKTDGRDWAREIEARASLMTETLKRGHENAVALLRRWTDETDLKLRAEIGADR